MARDGNEIRVEGMKELRKKLNKYGGPEIKKELNAAVKQGATQNVVPNARNQAPHQSGRLARSIKPRVNAKGVFIAASARYAGPVHYGWPKRNVGEQPFISDAISDHGPEFAKTYEAIMRIYAIKVSRILNDRNRRRRR